MRFGLMLLALIAPPALADAPRVMTDIPPVQAIVSAVMDGVGEPEVLLGQNQSPHDYSMRPSQARALAQADLVIWMGPQLTGWLEGPIDSLAVGAHMSLLDVPEATILAFRDDESADEHGHDDAHSHAGDIDPHAWLDPVNGALFAQAIAERLGQLDPENSQTYLSNANELRLDIEAASAEIAARFAALKPGAFIVLHDAFHYFEHRFGVETSGAVFDGHATTPGPQQIARLRDLVRDEEITCALAEPQQKIDLLNTIAEGAGLRVSIVDPLGNGTDYVALLENMATAIADCLSPTE